jgi:hypothetical protein
MLETMQLLYRILPSLTTMKESGLSGSDPNKNNLHPLDSLLDKSEGLTASNTRNGFHEENLSQSIYNVIQTNTKSL